MTTNLHFLKFLLPVLALFSVCTLRAQESQTFRSGGMIRSYTLHLPDNLPADAPLVFVLHGYGGSADPVRFGMNATADRHGFAVCYPQGAKDKRGKNCWNVGYPFQEGLKTDDVKFLCDLARDLQRKHHLSRRNTFCTGHSNGGEMCYQLAAQRPDVFAAVAPVSGLMMEWLYKADRSTVAVPLFELHGTKDKTSAWEGDPTGKGGWGAYMPVPLAVHYWAAKDRCTAMQTDTIPASGAKNSFTVIRHKFTGGDRGTEVWLYEVVDGKHAWGGQGYDPCEEVWQFFSRFLK